ncbi:MAG: YraN family protein [Patescibacteria group bacterium]|nr:YraN family protein [Patescibacteria group bacterium]
MLKLGEVGEVLAAKYLRIKGFKITKTGFRTYVGEIDIVAEKNSNLYFVEVKTRSSLNFGRPSEAVNYRKQNKIKEVAKEYLQKYPFDGEVHLGVIEILHKKSERRYLVNWIPEAFLGVD